jgi:Leucine-rich repeat (LRR) protein
MRTIAFTLLFSAFCLSPLTLFAQRLSLTPAAVTIVEGESEDFTVVLSSQPTGNVTVTIVTRNGADISLDGSVLIFTPSNWNQPQKVTIMADQDADLSDNNRALILIASGGGYIGNGVAVSPDTAMVRSPGETFQLNAVIQDQDDDPVTGVVLDWSSADSSIAVVDSTGKVTGVSPGRTTIAAAFATAEGAATILVDYPGDFNTFTGLRIGDDGSVTLRTGNITLNVGMAECLTGGDTLNGNRFDYHWTAWQQDTGSGWTEVSGTKRADNKLCGYDLASATPGKYRLVGNMTLAGVRGDFKSENEVTVSGGGGNQSPVAVGSIPDSSVDVGDDISVDDVSPYFSDPDGDVLTYTAASSDTGLATVSVSGSTVTVTGVAEGSATVTVTATDPGGLSATQSFNVTVDLISNTLADREILEILFKATDGPNWVNNDNWLTDAPLENWHGVSTDAVGNVTELRLSENNLTGSIPPELGGLTYLQELTFWDNKLTGPIPPELGSLINLETLALGSNKLSGPIPSELGSLSNLWQLHLPNNELSGPIPPELGSLINLETLPLNNNALSGPIPPELGSLSNLWELTLSNNKLSGTIPPSFQQLLRLQIFSFHDNSNLCLPDILVVWYEGLNDRRGPVCPDREVLRALYETAGGNDWVNATGWLQDGPLNAWYGVDMDLSGRVSALDLAGNGLSGSLSARVGDLAGLTALRIGDNALTGPLPTALRLLPLQELHYANTGLCAPGYASFQMWLAGIPSHQGTGKECAPLSDREILEVVYNVTNGHDWEESDNWLTNAPLGQWHGVKTNAEGRVASLDLRFNGLSGPIPSELGGLAELETLILFRNRLTGPIPSELGNLAKAKLIVLAANELSGPIPPELDGLANVEELWLNGNQLTSVPPELGQLASLNVLSLSFNQLTSVPPELGQSPTLKVLSLNFNQLTSVPPELGGLIQLRELELWSNQLISVPPELGQLINLEFLDLEENQLASIPPEFGRLESLTTLYLSSNELISIPEELSALNVLQRLYLDGNQLTSLPDLSDGFSFLRLLDLSSNGFVSFPWELAELSSLQILELDGNRLADFPPRPDHISDARQIVSHSAQEPSFLERWSESDDPWRLESDVNLHPSVSRKLDRLRALQARMTDDANHTMAGRVRPDIFPALEVLDLSSNELSGPLPETLLEFTGIASLGLADNVNLVGPLPLGLTALEQLENLHTSGTGLCAPADPVFLDWLNGVTRQRVAHCKQGETQTAYLTQAVQSREFPVPLVADEPALLRVFLTVQAGSASIPPVRATFYQDGAIVHRAEIPGTSNRIPTNVDEGSLSKSANVEIPGHVIQPGLEVVIEPDPDGTLDPALGVVRRIPATGRMAVDVRAMPAFEVTLVPFIWQENPDYSIIDIVAAMAIDPEGHELFERTHLLLPVSEIKATAHEPVMTSTNDGFDLLGEVETIRIAEGGRGHYLAVMAPPTSPGGLLGVANGIGSWSSFSVLDSETIAHEFGHNRALYHAPCGGAGGPDRFYPYEDGNIGAWGYDFDTAELVPPSQPDFMSYCEPTWTSDYQFTNAVRYRLNTETNSSQIAADIARVASDRTLMLWGGLDDEGTPYLRPSFFIDAPPVLPEADGLWSLTGTDEAGTVLFSLSFAMAEFTDTDNQRAGFSFAVPVTWTEELEAITLQGPDSSASLDRDTDQPITILRDATTGRIRGILEGFQEAAAQSMVAATGEDPQNIQILFSRGIPDPAAARR